MHGLRRTVCRLALRSLLPRQDAPTIPKARFVYNQLPSRHGRCWLRVNSSSMSGAARAARFLRSAPRAPFFATMGPAGPTFLLHPHRGAQSRERRLTTFSLPISNPSTSTMASSGNASTLGSSVRFRTSGERQCRTSSRLARRPTGAEPSSSMTAPLGPRCAPRRADSRLSGAARAATSSRLETEAPFSTLTGPRARTCTLSDRHFSIPRLGAGQASFSTSMEPIGRAFPRGRSYVRRRIFTPSGAARAAPCSPLVAGI